MSEPSGVVLTPPPMMLSYQELVGIRTRMERLDAKLDAALALRGEVDRLKEQVRHLELQQASHHGSTSVMKLVWNGVYALGAALIGAVGSRFLPF